MPGANELVSAARDAARKELERGLFVGMQGWLSLDPRLGMRERLEYAPPSADAAVDQTPVH